MTIYYSKQENETTKLDYLDLWKYFRNDAARIKDKLCDNSLLLVYFIKWTSRFYS